MTDPTPLVEPPDLTPEDKARMFANIKAALGQVPPTPVGHLFLPREYQQHRLSHTELVARPRLTRWWEGIWFALFRRLIRYVIAHTEPDVDDDELAAALENIATIQPREVEIVVVFDETEAEHLARLQRLYGDALKTGAAVPPGVGIPVTTSPLVPRGTAYLMSPDALQPLLPERGIRFDDRPASVTDVTVDPADA